MKQRSELELSDRVLGDVVTTTQGNVVVLRKSTWEDKISVQHDELRDHKDLVLDTIRNPDRIYPSRPNAENQRTSNFMYYGNSNSGDMGKFVVVPVIEMDEPMEVIGHGTVPSGSFRVVTAYTTDTPPNGRAIFSGKKS